jgi:hypothetical protein
MDAEPHNEYNRQRRDSLTVDCRDAARRVALLAGAAALEVTRVARGVLGRGFEE